MNKTTGDCFEVAGRIVIDNNGETMLCHGTVVAKGVPRHKHAWVEMGDVCIDRSNGHNVTMRKNEYYKLGKVKDIVTYTKIQACELMLKTEHFGPWEKGT